MVYNQLEIDGRVYDITAFPVGAIYMSVNSTSPASLFGGTWERLKDRFLLGAGDTYSAAATGGSASVTLTKAQLPEHRHGIGTELDANYVYANVLPADAENGLHSTYFDSTSGKAIRPENNYRRLVANDNLETRGESHNNMPPYLTVYMWKRTA